MMQKVILLSTLFLGAGACVRTHMSKSYGQTVRQALKAQVISPAAGARRVSEQGLDPEEAAIVSKSYRDSLTPNKSETQRTPMVVLPTQQGLAPGMPPAGMR
jgi:hypothetical protein